METKDVVTARPIIIHVRGCRTLIKQGHQPTLEALQFELCLISTSASVQRHRSCIMALTPADLQTGTKSRG